MKKYPYQDLSLADITGERWKDVPGLEMYCKISSYGRLKRMEYELKYSDGRVYIKPEKIIKPVVMKLANRFMRDDIFFLHSKIVLQGTVYNYSLGRLVYHCFKEPFDLDDQSILILTEDGDGLDINVSNLKMASHREKQKRIFGLNRRESFAPGSKGKLKAIATLRKLNNKQVTKYNLQGKKIKTYLSVTTASKETGISHNHICSRARGIEFSAGGFIWRYGNKETIDLNPLIEATKQRHVRDKEAFGKKVTQYKMNGTRVATYPSINDVSKATGVATSEISKVINHFRNWYSPGGFYGRKGYGAVKINP